MGGYNSGRWGWHTKAVTVQQCSQISSSGLPAVGESSGNPSVTIARMDTDSVIVTYEIPAVIRRVAEEILRERGKPYTPRTEPPEPLYRHVIRLSFSPRHLGSGQWYFICPHCQRRALKLYWRYGRFACRTCQGLTYESCQKSHEYDRGGGYLGALKRVFLYEDRQKKIGILFERLGRCRKGSKVSIRLKIRIMQLSENLSFTMESVNRQNI